MRAHGIIVNYYVSEETLVPRVGEGKLKFDIKKADKGLISTVKR